MRFNLYIICMYIGIVYSILPTGNQTLSNRRLEYFLHDCTYLPIFYLVSFQHLSNREACNRASITEYNNYTYDGNYVMIEVDDSRLLLEISQIILIKFYKYIYYRHFSNTEIWNDLHLHTVVQAMAWALALLCFFLFILSFIFILMTKFRQNILR